VVSENTKASFNTLGAAVGRIEIDDPIHRIRSAVAAPAMWIQRNLFEAANAQPLLPDWLARLRAAKREAKHDLVNKQRLCQEESDSVVFWRRVFCWSKATASKTRGLT
jgi:hypothetical protein